MSLHLIRIYTASGGNAISGYIGITPYTQMFKTSASRSNTTCYSAGTVRTVPVAILAQATIYPLLPMNYVQCRAPVVAFQHSHNFKLRQIHNRYSDSKAIRTTMVKVCQLSSASDSIPDAGSEHPDNGLEQRASDRSETKRRKEKIIEYCYL